MVERIPLSRQEPVSREKKWEVESDRNHENAWLQQQFAIVEGTDLHMVAMTGVMHTPKTFEMHKEDIEKTVKDADVVLLEGYSKREMPVEIPGDFPSNKDV